MCVHFVIECLCLSKVRALPSFSSFFCLLPATYLFLSLRLVPYPSLSLWLMGEDRLPLLRFLIPETCRHTGAVNRYLPARLNDWLTDCPTNLASPRYCGNIQEEGDGRRKMVVMRHMGYIRVGLSCPDMHASVFKGTILLLSENHSVISEMQYVNTWILIRWNKKVEIYF